ncbi:MULTISPECIES: NAD-dependent succinate-semialdehyde dehydrogenase [unclassified Chelatococcus]|uniref:NAD-dependent succinate-semialdehyde dehydrogenase n=1 Tax=unclassified Chelatococcus TaxID=2638111 RepID=UPI001BD17F56|nr:MULTISPECIES: NAD-dependent succinate-semialdehyde dehydrogenase [unclassified Chelatococcus]MBS7699948.1 NAD-dependent succinate-semialdehyde dehydrogenase [Chelatococcus sp. YT9]MBX3558627.1 NAD-dependent succinate-semialdehyde dehydrogenase [Chelatococcus sp.]
MSDPFHYPPLKLLIDGHWINSDGRATILVENPSTGETLGALPVATESDVTRAVAAARRSFDAWRTTHPQKRVAILRKAASLIRSRTDEMATLMALEQGKPLRDGPAEANRAADHFEWHAEMSLRLLGEVIPGAPGVAQMALRVPVGPVAAFSPWNGPGASPARKMAAALAAGCTLVIKPAEETPATALLIAQCLLEAGVPAGVLNVIFGDPRQISDQLIASPDIRMLTFTGSVPVGRSLAAKAGHYLKPMILELGGHAPVIVCGDADPIVTAQISAGAKFRNAGQICISPTRFYVHGDIHDRFVDSFVAATEALVVGDPLAKDTQMGPMIHSRRLSAVDALIQDAIARGATLRTGGRRIGNTGAFYAPTVLTDVPDSARIMSEEPFGPVAVFQTFTDLREVCDRANATSFGLASYAFTDSAAAIAMISDRVEAGGLSINQFTGSSPEMPFGGVKDSGYGREGGAQCFDGYLTYKSISHKISA